MCRVMIIDDENATRNLLKITLEKENLGLNIVGEAASGIEAINIIDELRPDIAFVDIRMPFMNGIEFSKLAIRRYPNLKIIILTAFHEFEYARDCIGIGVCDYLLKPISREEIRNIMVKLIEQVKEEHMVEPQEAPVQDEYTTIMEIKNYLSTHFQNPDINLTYIALQYGFNPSYLSRMFKNKTGMGLIDYLTQIRMEHAKTLAQQKKLMYITAKEVGIPDPNYFGKCFKKYVGVAYSEYIK